MEMRLQSTLVALLLVSQQPPPLVTDLAVPRPRGARSLDSDDPLLSRRGGQLLAGGVPFTGHVVKRRADGSTRAVTPYRDGLLHGTALTWHADGQLDTVRHYEDGAKVGRHSGYWPDGTPRFEETFEGGLYNGPLYTWYEGGAPHSLRHFVGGREDGEQRLWAEDGRLRSNYVVRNGRRFGKVGAMPCSTVRGEES